MLRIIPRLDIKDNNLIKTICLEGLRQIGDPNIYAKDYVNQGADELLFMDIVASLYGRNNLFHIINEISKEIFIPITVGGGIRSLKDAIKLLESGADKVALNSGCFSDRNLINEISNRIGVSSVVLSIEAKKIKSEWYSFYNSGRENSGIKVEDWIEENINKGVGEILLTSVDSEGTEKGFDLKLLEKIKKRNIQIPLTISGGVANIKNILDARQVTNISGVCVASSLHYKKKTICDFRDNFKNYE
jgi:cyclase